jgi:uncharacterized protein YjiS (DUF1127 family)
MHETELVMYAQIYGRTSVALGHRRRTRSSLKRLATRLFDRLQAWQEHAHSRRVLASLDERMLRDIGIDRATAVKESTTPFWR